jgi:hypothetical protein
MPTKLSFMAEDWIVDDIINTRPRGQSVSSRIRELLIKGAKYTKEVRSDVAQKKL